MQATTVGVDLAKNVVHVHGVDACGHVVFRRRLPRKQLLPFMAQFVLSTIIWQKMPDSIGLCGGACYRSSKVSRGEDLEVEQPVPCRDCAAFHFHATLAGMPGPTLIRH